MLLKLFGLKKTFKQNKSRIYMIRINLRIILVKRLIFKKVQENFKYYKLQIITKKYWAKILKNPKSLIFKDDYLSLKINWVANV